MSDASVANEDPSTPAPLTPEQIANHQVPEDPRISPDGSRILFTVRAASNSSEHPVCAIWAADVDSGETFQFSTGVTADTEPRWSPDGSRIALLSDRAERGKQAVYVMPAAGGEAVRVFDQEGDMESLNWSPDGTRLAVIVTEPETDEEKKRNEEKDDVNVWDTDYKFQRLWVLDPVAKSATCVSPEGRHVVRYAWAPDSLRLVLNLTSTPRIDDIFKNTDLSVVTRDGGETISVHSPYGDTHDLVWSRDGSKIAWIGPAGRVVNADYVYSISVDGGEPVCLTEGYEGTVESLRLQGDGDSLIIHGAESIYSAVYLLGWDGSMQQLYSTQGDGSLAEPPSVSHDGQRIAFVRESMSSPPDVWVFQTGAEDSSPSKLTNLNPELGNAALGEAELVRWSSDADVDIEGILLKPHGYKSGEKYPLIALVHGGPTWRWTDGFHATWAQSLAGNGFAILMPNPRGSTGRGPAFSNAIYNDVGGGEFRDMMTGVDAMIERGIADPDRLGVGGWSWGGYMTGWTISQTTRFKAAIMGAGLPNMVSDNGIGDIPTANLSYFEKTVYEDPEPYWERSAIRHLRNATTPTLILHGEEDRRVAMPQGMELYTGLRTLGIETQFVTYPREPHGIRETKHQIDLVKRVIDWYTKHLKD